MSTLPRLDERIAFGAGLRASPICLGAAETPEVVESAFEAGINFFFISTDLHWPAYEGVREGVRRLLRRPGVRDQIVICATTYMVQEAFTAKPFDELLDVMPGLGHFDVVCAGGVYATDVSRRLPIFGSRRANGFMGNRSVAASFHDRAAARTALADKTVDLAFFRYNPVHPGAQTDLLPFVKATDAPLFAFKSSFGYLSEQKLIELGVPSDNWYPRRVDFYRYALSHPGISGLLLALDEVEHVRHLADALAQGPLSGDEQGYLEALTQHVLSASTE